MTNRIMKYTKINYNQAIKQWKLKVGCEKSPRIKQPAVKTYRLSQEGDKVFSKYTSDGFWIMNESCKKLGKLLLALQIPTHDKVR